MSSAIPESLYEQLSHQLSQVVGFIYPNEVETQWAILIVVYPDPKQRLRDIGEAPIVLGGGAAGAHEPPRVPSPTGASTRPGRISRLLPWGIAVLAVIVAVGVGTLRKSPPAGKQVSLSVVLPRGDRLDAGIENQRVGDRPRRGRGGLHRPP